MSHAADTFLKETPILMETLAETVGTTPADVAEHIGGMDGDKLVEGYTIGEFVDNYGRPKK